MIDISRHFTRGLHGTIRALNGANFSYAGPWTQVFENTEVDRWHVGEFFSAKYTIAIDYNTNKKEILECLLVAGPDHASVVVYGRSNLNQPLIDISASVNNSYVSLIATPLISEELDPSGCKLMFTADYFCTVNDLRPD
jgi:hypothetical protein